MVRRDQVLARDQLPSFPETTTQRGEPSHNDLLSAKQDERLSLKRGDIEGDQSETEPRKPEGERAEAARGDDGFTELSAFPMCLLGEASAAVPSSNVPLAAPEEIKEPEPIDAEEESKAELPDLAVQIDAAQSMDEVQLDQELKEEEATPLVESDPDAMGVDADQVEFEFALDLFDIAPPRPTLRRQDVLDRADIEMKPSRDSMQLDAPPQIKSKRWAIPSEPRVGGVVDHLRYANVKPTRRGLFRLF